MSDKALLLGINNYEAISALRGCLNDVARMEKLLIESFGFAAKNVRLMRDEEVRKEGVLKAMDWLLEGAQAGDRLVFHFSGHGSQIASNKNDEPTDELLCLQDMTWNDPESYLLDDELGNFAARVPQGVRLTFVLDSCHSGDGTRGLMTDSGPARLIVKDSLTQLPQHDRTRELLTSSSRTLSAKVIEEVGLAEGQRVIARYVEPPPRMRDKIAQRRRRTFRQVLAERALNHQLFAGAGENETAADAYIEEDYHGAFTFYLVRTLQFQNGQLSAKTAYDVTRQALASGGFGQTPQLEGPFGDERVFGGLLDKAELIAPPVPDCNPCGSQEVSSHSRPLPASLATVDRLLDVADRFLSIVERVLHAGDSAESQTGSIMRSAAETVVYVHGIGNHAANYADAWWASMRPYLSRPLQVQAVRWSDLVNSRSGGPASGDPSGSTAENEAARLRSELQAALDQRIDADQHLAQKSRPAGTATSRLIRTERGSGLAIDDFVRYMLDSRIRAQVLQRFEERVRPLLEAGATVQIISHSWGTVVAYEGLRRLDGLSLPGRVANLFLVGSALSIDVVRANLFSRTTDGRRPQHVQRIYNLDAGGDPVGGSVAGAISVDQERIGLEPTGCRTFPFTNIAISPFCAHSSYFVPGNLAVNRDIFAQRING